MNARETRESVRTLFSELVVGPLRIDEVIESAPSDTYVTGILWPKGEGIGAAEDEEDSGPEDTTSEVVEAAVPGYRVRKPCSVGISFSVRTGATLQISLANTARYTPIDADGVGEQADDATAPNGGTVKWKRVPLGYRKTIAPELTTNSWKIREFDLPGGGSTPDKGITIDVRRRHYQDVQVFTVTLINSTGSGNSQAARGDERYLFQAGLSVVATDANGKAAIVPRPKLFGGAEEDAQTNALLYRDVFEFAVGHGIAASWDEGSHTAVSEVRTEWLPVATVKGTTPDGHTLLRSFAKEQPEALRAEFLGDERNRKRTVGILRSFAQCYERWIVDLAKQRSGLDSVLASAAERNLGRCSSALGRIRDGISLLESNDSAWTAFALANAAMDRQSRFPGKGDRQGPLVWRPFQLAFILLVIPGIVDPSREDRECMDLLWFPTGGGKTEAYLALIAFQIFFRRLESAERRSSGGVDVLMRYTLRLLTVQQFQRAAALILACDLIRAKQSRLGDAPISLGLYVGGDATPNRMADARDALEQERAGNSPRSTPRQLLRCPACGENLTPGCYRASADEAQIDIICNKKGCEVSGLPLPVLTVDETIYASPPSLLIGTIDKFAQLPRSTVIRRLFGLDEGNRPALIIQDELHLISGPLGSIAGLYETAVDLLCTKDSIRPKVIGSTATIGEAARQVRALFDRAVFQFPPPGFDAADSFFAVRDELGPDRKYIGISSAGRSPKFALQAAVAALLQSAAQIRSREACDVKLLDPYWTCVAYFNSLRELGGAYVLFQDDVPRHMAFLATRLGVAVRKLELEPVELSSRVTSRDLPLKLQQLEASLAQSDDPYAAEPPDTVLASNMISVGVDVPRLGLMVVNGQPKSTAEYIQASSRIGRGIPGIVVTLYNFGRPRDLSHFEHFQAYHAALYRDVEATSVTPWAPRARDKAFHAVVAALVRHLVPGMFNDEDAVSFDETNPAVLPLLQYIMDRVARASHGIETDDAQEGLDAIVERWAQRSLNGRRSGTRLLYWERKAPFGKTAPHLMISAEEGARVTALAWPTPNSMREIEPSTAFVLKRTNPVGGAS